MTRLKPWQLVAALGGAIITGGMAAAAVFYNTSLGDGAVLFATPWLSLTSNQVFGAMALAFDLLMVAAIFGVFHWRALGQPAAAVLCGMIFVIASLFSVHSARGFIASNLTRSMAPSARNADVYASIKSDLAGKQLQVETLRSLVVTADGTRQRLSMQTEIDKAEAAVANLRGQLQLVPIEKKAPPAQGYEWLLAGMMWFVNATCWFAFLATHGNRNSNAKNQEKSDQTEACKIEKIAEPSPEPLDQQLDPEPDNSTVINLAGIREARALLKTEGVKGDDEFGTFIGSLNRDTYDWGTLKYLYRAYCHVNGHAPIAPSYFARRLNGRGWWRVEDTNTYARGGGTAAVQAA